MPRGNRRRRVGHRRNAAKLDDKQDRHEDGKGLVDPGPRQRDATLPGPAAFDHQHDDRGDDGTSRGKVPADDQNHDQTGGGQRPSFPPERPNDHDGNAERNDEGDDRWTGGRRRLHARDGVYLQQPGHGDQRRIPPEATQRTRQAR